MGTPLASSGAVKAMPSSRFSTGATVYSQVGCNVTLHPSNHSGHSFDVIEFRKFFIGLQAIEIHSTAKREQAPLPRGDVR